MPPQIFDYLNAIYRQRLLALCVFCVGAILTLWTAHSLPDVYRSTTLIMVEPQGVPESYVKATVTTKFEQRLNALNQEVLSRTRLETIIDDFDESREMRAAGAPREQVVEAMRGRIHIETSSRDNASAFRISYDAADAATAQRVTARLAGLYIDENLRLRDQQVTGTTEFLESELEKGKQQLEQQEALIKTFKLAHMGELPEQREANMRALEGLRVQLQTGSLSLSAAQERKVLLEKQAQDARASYQTDHQGSGTSAPPTDPRMQLQQLETQLRDMRGRYTEDHPDVVQLRGRVARLKAELGSAPSGVAMDPRIPPELARALEDVTLEINRLKTERDNVTRSITMYQNRIEATFSREQELLGLERDYGVTEKKYATLLDKKLEAQLSQSLERRQKGERFRVLDPASLPERPARPDRFLVVALGLGVSLFLALGVPVLLWQLDSSLQTTEEIVAACSLPVLTVIPQVKTPEIEGRWLRYQLRVVSVSVVALVVGLGAVTVYAKYLY